jgi:uncharacterized protein with von Willebrand factor type A (vWA) domain
MADNTEVDLAELVARFGARLRTAGLAVGPDRCERFARAITVARPATLAQLRWCARATLAAGPDELAVLDRVFDAVFGGYSDPAGDRGDPTAPGVPGSQPAASSPDSTVDSNGKNGRQPAEDDAGVRAAAVERLANRDFAELTDDELALLTDAMREVPLETPLRRARRTHRVAHGSRVDLRATLRQGRRTGGDPIDLVRQRSREKPRRLVVLCDISGSMAPYARAMLQLLYCAARTGERAEVFTFATRLTRLTQVLAGPSVRYALDRAGQAAPDWSGGTRIGAALKEFVDRYGRPGLARGAVVLIISDGWESGDPAALGWEMARLSRLAYRIVWSNPRTQSPRYRPLVGGMAAAWPYCDAVVSGHSLAALPALAAALKGRSPY